MSIFLSYRRSDAKWAAQLLKDAILAKRPFANVFLDVDDIRPGDNFEEAIKSSFQGDLITLVLIGDTWGSVKSSTGEKRLDNPNDWVRAEVRSAIRSKRAGDGAVIPVLLDDAKMPTSDQLPDDLKDFAKYQGIRIRSSHFRADVRPLVAALSKNIRTVDRLRSLARNPRRYVISAAIRRWGTVLLLAAMAGLQLRQFF